MRNVILCLLLFTALCQFNLKGQTLRPDGWYADYIQYLHNRGYLWDLSPLEQPYSAQEVKRETANVKREETDNGYQMPDAGYQMPDSGYRMPDARFLERLKMLLEQLPQEEEAVLGWLQSGNDYRNTESGSY